MQQKIQQLRFTRRRLATAGAVVIAAAIAPLSLVISAQAGSSEPTRPIAVNQTDGFGQGRVGVFTYFQNYACVHEPFADLDGNGKPAAADPDEFDTPRCEVGSEPTIDPAGKRTKDTAPLYVLVPFFDADGDAQAADGLAAPLKERFGFVPDAFDPTPGVPVQCPEPGPPLSRLKGDFGTCTLHPKTVDLDPALKALGVKPVGARLPTVNHSHVIENINYKAVWWQLRIVLVTDRRAWPDVNGTNGITSVEAMRQAIIKGQANPDVPTNAFLFFDSRKLAHQH